MAKHNAGKHARVSADDAAKLEATETEAFATARNNSEAASDTTQTIPAQVSAFDQDADYVNAMPMDQAYVGSVAPALDLEAMARADRKRGLKIFGISVGIVVAVLLIAYLAGVFVFSGRHFPHTTIGSTDISMKTTEEVAQDLDSLAQSYTFKVTGQGLNLNLTASDIGLTVDSQGIAESIMNDVNPWAWPVEIFNNHDESDVLAGTYGTTGLNDTINAAVQAVNANAIAPVNATIGYNQQAKAYKVVPEVAGTLLDPAKVVEQVAAGAASFAPKVEITTDALVQPEIRQDDPRLAAAVDQANSMIRADLNLYMENNFVTEVTPELISSWITVTPEVTVAFNDELYNAFVKEVEAGCDTVGKERSYVRPDGKVVTVKGGSYGWEIDTKAFKDQLTQAINAGTVGDFAIPVLQTGNGFTAMGEKDWGNRYCDIDLAEQHARFYDDAGVLVWETDVVTGMPDGKHDTPPGVYYVTGGKQSPSKLVGEKDPATGIPEYETMVTYWMPFIGNSIGLHDANWQSAFGGSRYAQGYGSHGCVNISVPAAEQLYGIIQVGDVVVVHW